MHYICARHGLWTPSSLCQGCGASIMRLGQATQLAENCNVMHLHAVRQFSAEHCIMFGCIDQESRLAVLDCARCCCPESCQWKHELEIWCSTAALLWHRLLQKRVGAKRPPCIVHVEEMVAMLIVVCKYLGASVDAATLKICKPFHMQPSWHPN